MRPHSPQGILESEWRQRSVLPAPPTSAPSSSAQKVHARKDPPERAAAQPPPATKAQAATPARKSSKAPAAPPPTKAVEPTPAGSAQPAETARAKSPERAASPEIDVDVGGTPEPEVVGHDGARDGESDEIVRQLEKGLPRWEGLADAGWTDEVDAVSTPVPGPVWARPRPADSHMTGPHGGHRRHDLQV